MNIVLKALAAAAAMVIALPATAAAAPSLFGTAEFRAPSLQALPKWQKTLRRIERERSTYEACSQAAEACPSPGAAAWQAMLRSQAGRPKMAQLRAVNAFLNDWQYKTDDRNYGRSDYWATPLEFLRRSGDCEDYAIAKYVSLRQLGFSADQLRIVVLQDVKRNLAHAVLAVYLNDQVYVLDNVTRAVLTQEELPHYVPYYSINETTRWAHAAPADRAVASAARRTSPAASAQR